MEREVVTAAQGADLLVCALDGDPTRPGPATFVADHAPLPRPRHLADRAPEHHAAPSARARPPPPNPRTMRRPGAVDAMEPWSRELRADRLKVRGGAMDRRPPAVVLPPATDGGRRAAIRGERMGTAYSLFDVLDFLHEAGLPPRTPPSTTSN